MRLSVGLLWLGFAATSQAGFVEDLQKAKKEGPEAVEKVQREYAKPEADNPKYYIDLANYWFGVSQQPNLSTKPAEGGDFVVADQKTGQAVGSMSRTGIVDPKIGGMAPRLLTKATERFPERTDIWLGLAYILRKEDRMIDAGNVMILLLERTRTKPGTFVTPKGETVPFERAAGYVDNAAFDTVAGLFRMEYKEGEDLCGRLALSMTQTFPEDVRAYNVLAALANRKGDDKEAMRWLEKAREVDPEDAIVALNLADNYLKVGNKAKARELAQNVLSSQTELAKKYHEEAKALLEAAK